MQKKLNLWEEEGGIGLVNVKKRLKLLYPNKYKMSVREERGFYLLELHLTL